MTSKTATCPDCGVTGPKEEMLPRRDRKGCIRHYRCVACHKKSKTRPGKAQPGSKK